MKSDDREMKVERSVSITHHFVLPFPWQQRSLVRNVHCAFNCPRTIPIEESKVCKTWCLFYQICL